MNSDYLILALRRFSRINFIPYALIAVALVFTLMGLVDYWSNDDSISSNPVLNSENTQYEIRVNESRFRDRIIKDLSNLYVDKSYTALDSISKNLEVIAEVKKAIVLHRLKIDSSKYEFDIKVDKTTSPFVLLSKLHTTFEIDFEKLYNILKVSNPQIVDDNIRYGNFVKTSYKYVKKIRIDIVIITIFTILVVLIISYFIKRIGGKEKKEKLEELLESLNAAKDSIKEAKVILNENQITLFEIDRLKRLCDKLELDLEKYEFGSILKSVFYEDLIKSERRSVELYNRSTLMLVLGLLVAIVGILVFYFTIPAFENLKKTAEYLAFAIRPTFILLFIQSIAFYLLRQYRLLINDYKYFYNEYLKKSKIFIAYQLMQNNELNESEKKLIDKLVSEKSDVIQTEEKEADIPSDKIIEILKVLVEKLK